MTGLLTVAMRCCRRQCLGANPTNRRHKFMHVMAHPLPILKLWSVVFGIFGVAVSPIYYAYLVITLVPRIRLLAYILAVIREKGLALLAALLGGFLVLYGFSVLTFVNFREEYVFPDLELDCDTLFKCVLSHFDYGFRTAPSWPGISGFSTSFAFQVFAFNTVYQVGGVDGVFVGGGFAFLTPVFLFALAGVCRPHPHRRHQRYRDRRLSATA